MQLGNKTNSKCGLSETEMVLHLRHHDEHVLSTDDARGDYEVMSSCFDPSSPVNTSDVITKQLPSNTSCR